MTRRRQSRALWARWGLDPIEGVYDGILIRWDGDRLLGVERCPRPPSDLPAQARFDRHLLTPGLLNAHAHLDYSFLRGKLARPRNFTDWLSGLLRATAEELGDCRHEPETARSPAACQAAVEAIDRMVSDGVTEVWDIATFGIAREALAQSGLRGIVFEECVGGFDTDGRIHWERWLARHSSAFAGSVRTGNRWIAGLSPHSVYSLHPEALRVAAAWATEREAPMAIHLAESPEENDWLIEGGGPMRQMAEELGSADRREILGTGSSPIMRARKAGVLGPATLAIHCNLPQPGEVEVLARSRCVVVFCPCSHAFFGYPPYPLTRMKAAGVRLALGTDSLASNSRLSVRAEAFRLLEGPFSPREILAAATGAMLGEDPPFGGRGRLQPGRGADWALWRLTAEGQRATEEALIESWLAASSACECSSAWETGSSDRP